MDTVAPTKTDASKCYVFSMEDVVFLPVVSTAASASGIPSSASPSPISNLSTTPGSSPRLNTTNSIDPSTMIGKRGRYGFVRHALFSFNNSTQTAIAVKTLNYTPPSSEENSIYSAISKTISSEVQKLNEAINEMQKHPRLAVWLGILESPPSLSLVMEYFPGGSLLDYIASNKTTMEWLEKYIISKDVAEALSFLHSKRSLDGKKKQVIHHSNLKSSNVLLYREPSVNNIGGKNNIKGQLRAKVTDVALPDLVAGLQQFITKKSKSASTEKLMIAVDDVAGI